LFIRLIFPNRPIADCMDCAWYRSACHILLQTDTNGKRILTVSCHGHEPACRGHEPVFIFAVLCYEVPTQSINTNMIRNTFIVIHPCLSHCFNMYSFILLVLFASGPAWSRVSYPNSSDSHGFHGRRQDFETGSLSQKSRIFTVNFRFFLCS
jgi:hypothetical protein